MTQQEKLVSVFKLVEKMAGDLLTVHDTLENGGFDVKDYPDIVLVDRVLLASFNSLDAATIMLERMTKAQQPTTVAPDIQAQS